MEYTRLGTTGLLVSRICLGMMSFGDPARGTHPWSLPEEDSRRVIEKLDLRDEGVAVRYLAINGRWEDHIRYALTAEEWAERGQELVDEWIGPPPAPVLRLRQRD